MEELLERCGKLKKIFIYGDGEVGRLTRIFLHEQGIEAAAFVVTGVPRVNRLMDIPVYRIYDVSESTDEAMFIICMHKKHWKDAVSVLESIGAYDYIIVDDKVRESIVDRVTFKDIYEDVEAGKYINTLLYHRIEELDTTYSLIVNKRNFEEQLKFIKANYDLLRCDESWDGINRKSIAVTFDDGYVDFYNNAYPLLEKYGVPATVFIATGNIDTNNEFWWDELERLIIDSTLPREIRVCGKDYFIDEETDRKELLYDIHDRIINYKYKDRDMEIGSLKRQMGFEDAGRERYRTLSTREIQELSLKPLVTIGAHTVSHILCDIEDKEIVEGEIRKSKEDLENIIDKEVNLFAYPNGNIGLETRDILKELGFMRAFTCVNACIGHDDERFDIPRCPALNWSPKLMERRFRGMWQTGKEI